jgi:carbamoyltransferase
MSQWIAGIARGHNSGVCLLKDGEIVFSIEEERLSRKKYDGGPYASMIKILDYTDKIDFLVIAHTQPDHSRVDFRGGSVYTGLANKIGLIENESFDDEGISNQVLDMHKWHHKLHASCAFYRSGFEDAVAVIVDGAGTFIPVNMSGTENEDMTWELETIFDCSYPDNFKTLYKHLAGRGPWKSVYIPEQPSEREAEEGTHELIVDDSAGIVKAYEAVTQYCGFHPIEAGKTMGLFPYGGPADYFPPIYTDANGGDWKTADRNLIIPTYPNGALVNEGRYKKLNTSPEESEGDVTKLQNRRDMAYAVQTESQQMVLDLIRKAVKMGKSKNVVVSGGYGLNCVANYWYLDQLKDEGINLYVEPVSNDAGTAMGAALLAHYSLTKDKKTRPFGENLCLGPNVMQSEEEIFGIAEKYGATNLYEKQYAEDAVKLILKGNIVTLFQDKCENGPRALGNRSMLYDPRELNGKDYVNAVKKREYFRPFAGSILHEHAHEWFDMRGMEESPHMMYAMNCSSQEYADQIPAIIHIDGTCRIQTVKEHQNPIYYEMINHFYKETGVPILFNTSFNLAGEPLVETIDDAIRTLHNSDLEYLYIPEKALIIEIGNK